MKIFHIKNENTDKKDINILEPIKNQGEVSKEIEELILDAIKWGDIQINLFKECKAMPDLVFYYTEKRDEIIGKLNSLKEENDIQEIRKRCQALKKLDFGDEFAAFSKKYYSSYDEAMSFIFDQKLIHFNMNDINNFLSESLSKLRKLRLGYYGKEEMDAECSAIRLQAEEMIANAKKHPQYCQAIGAYSIEIDKLDDLRPNNICPPNADIKPYVALMSNSPKVQAQESKNIELNDSRDKKDLKKDNAEQMDNIKIETHKKNIKEENDELKKIEVTLKDMQNNAKWRQDADKIVESLKNKDLTVLYSKISYLEKNAFYNENFLRYVIQAVYRVKQKQQPSVFFLTLRLIFEMTALIAGSIFIVSLLYTIPKMKKTLKEYYSNIDKRVIERVVAKSDKSAKEKKGFLNSSGECRKQILSENSREDSILMTHQQSIRFGMMERKRMLQKQNHWDDKQEALFKQKKAASKERSRACCQI